MQKVHGIALSWKNQPAASEITIGFMEMFREGLSKEEASQELKAALTTAQGSVRLRHGELLIR